MMLADKAEIDLNLKQVRFGERVVDFEIDDDTRMRLLNGVDDIGMTLSDEQLISTYEREREISHRATTDLSA